MESTNKKYNEPVPNGEKKTIYATKFEGIEEPILI